MAQILIAIVQAVHDHPSQTDRILLKMKQTASEKMKQSLLKMIKKELMGMVPARDSFSHLKWMRTIQPIEEAQEDWSNLELLEVN